MNFRKKTVSVIQLDSNYCSFLNDQVQMFCLFPEFYLKHDWVNQYCFQIDFYIYEMFELLLAFLVGLLA